MSDTFPRQHARTQRLTLGEPRNFTVSPDGARIVFARSATGSDPVNILWVLDVESGTERTVLDPRNIPADLAALTDEEKRRRERAREGAGGVVSYSCDADATKAVTVLGGQLFVVDLLTDAVSTPAVAPGVFDARLREADMLAVDEHPKAYFVGERFEFGFDGGERGSVVERQRDADLGCGEHVDRSLVAIEDLEDTT